VGRACARLQNYCVRCVNLGRRKLLRFVFTLVCVMPFCKTEFLPFPSLPFLRKERIRTKKKGGEEVLKRNLHRAEIGDYETEDLSAPYQLATAHTICIARMQISLHPTISKHEKNTNAK